MRCGAIDDNLIVYLRDVPLRVAPMALEACASFAQVPGPCTILSGSPLTMLPSKLLFTLIKASSWHGLLSAKLFVDFFTPHSRRLDSCNSFHRRTAEVQKCGVQ